MINLECWVPYAYGKGHLHVAAEGSKGSGMLYLGGTLYQQGNALLKLFQHVHPNRRYSRLPYNSMFVTQQSDFGHYLLRRGKYGRSEVQAK